MAKKTETTKNLKPIVAAEGSSKFISAAKEREYEERDYADFLEYVYLAPSTTIKLAEAITWSDILDG